ncbi:MAG: acetolactate synthase small subunit [Candidatus Competibacterales bacterium]
MRHIISILLENEPGALSRVSNLFSARGYNIETLTVAPTEDPSLSRLTLVTTGTEEIIEQIVKQLNKLIDVVKLVDLTDGAHLERELALIKIRAEGEARAEFYRMAMIFKGEVIDVSDTAYTVELTGPSEHIDHFVEVVKSDNIVEIVRSGVIGIARGQKALRA